MDFRALFLLILQFLLALLLGCSREPVEAARDSRNGAPIEDRAQGTTNRIDVSETVRRNLGITFAKVEPRPVAQTIRVPGRFELLPQARREYRTMLGGRVTLLVNQYAHIEPGTALYRLDSPPWRELQGKLNDAEASIRLAQAQATSIGPLMAAHNQHEASLRESVGLWTQRIEQLEKNRASGVVTLDQFMLANTALATNRAQLAEVLEKEAELQAQKLEVEASLQATEARMKLLLATAATLLGVHESILSSPCTAELHEQFDAEHHSHTDEHTPLWREIDALIVRATDPGIVESIGLTNGAWASETSLVLATVQQEYVRFRARGMQSDLGRLRDGLPARIVPPKGGSIELQDTMSGQLSLGLGADPEERTLELIVVPDENAPWARPGVAAHLEVIVAGGQTELAIPLSSVIQDGLSKIIFRRDPNDLDKVIRLEADLGVNDGRWVVASSGVREGDEVVLDGVYQLMIATSGSVEKGGHFHSDGTFHEGKD